MAVGASGRIVIEVEPELKHELHAVLREDGKNLKEWFTEQAKTYLAQHGQLPLPFGESNRGLN